MQVYGYISKTETTNCKCPDFDFESFSAQKKNRHNSYNEKRLPFQTAFPLFRINFIL